MTRALIGSTAVLVVCSLLVGCGGQSSQDLALDPLQLIESVNTHPARHHPRDFVELDLGEFYLTLPIRDEVDMHMLTMQIILIVPESQRREVQEAIAHSESLMRDSIIAKIQHIDQENLADPEMSWLRAELLHLLRTRLQTNAIRDVIFPSITLEKG